MDERYVIDLGKSGDKYTVGLFDRITKRSKTYKHKTHAEAFRHFSDLRMEFFLSKVERTNLDYTDFANID